jgi:hypothetical protein
VDRRAETAAANAMASGSRQHWYGLGAQSMFECTAARGSDADAPATIASSFDHLIGAGEEGFGDRHPDCLCGFEIDDQLELGWLLDW